MQLHFLAKSCTFVQLPPHCPLIQAKLRKWGGRERLIVVDWAAAKGIAEIRANLVAFLFLPILLMAETKFHLNHLLMLNMEKLPKAWKQPRGNEEKDTYSVVQKSFPPVWNSRLISAKQNGQPMYSQLALTEPVSLNLAPLILLYPVHINNGP